MGFADHNQEKDDPYVPLLTRNVVCFPPFLPLSSLLRAKTLLT